MITTSLYICPHFHSFIQQHHKHIPSMASFKHIYATLTLLVLLSSTFCFGFPEFNFRWGHGRDGVSRPIGGGRSTGLFPGFYSHSCPQANDIVMSVLERAISKDSRMAASLLRLHFHDCFVQVNLSFFID